MSKQYALWKTGNLLRKAHENGFNQEQFEEFNEISREHYGKTVTKEKFLHYAETLFGNN